MRDIFPFTLEAVRVIRRNGCRLVLTCCGTHKNQLEQVEGSKLLFSTGVSAKDEENDPDRVFNPILLHELAPTGPDPQNKRSALGRLLQSESPKSSSAIEMHRLDAHMQMTTPAKSGAQEDAVVQELVASRELHTYEVRERTEHVAKAMHGARNSRSASIRSKPGSPFASRCPSTSPSVRSVASINELPEKSDAEGLDAAQM